MTGPRKSVRRTAGTETVCGDVGPSTSASASMPPGTKTYSSSSSSNWSMAISSCLACCTCKMRAATCRIPWRATSSATTELSANFSAARTFRSRMGPPAWSAALPPRPVRAGSCRRPGRRTPRRAPPRTVRGCETAREAVPHRPAGPDRDQLSDGNHEAGGRLTEIRPGHHPDRPAKVLVPYGAAAEATGDAIRAGHPRARLPAHGLRENRRSGWRVRASPPSRCRGAVPDRYRSRRCPAATPRHPSRLRPARGPTALRVP